MLALVLQLFDVQSQRACILGAATTVVAPAIVRTNG